ncbi:MAG: division/cell wall cluster transcriptional repressor MraZ [Deltaproteobacteria bacterium]|nr:division/cell wall cluster transcriptional repressor MraZ [Deltaproteobacteria bacterium]
MFSGLYEHTLDAKGRLSLPSHFRELLRNCATDIPTASSAQAETEKTKAKTCDAKTSDAELLIITTGIDRCLVAYPPARWREFEDKLAKLSQFDPAVVQLKRIYVAGATECPIDKHGRLLIPPMLREYAELKTETVWAGMVTTIEIWARERWNEQVAQSRQDPAAITKALTELGL